jgi:hypothetical protein
LCCEQANFYNKLISSSIHVLFIVQQRSRLCALIAERTGEQIPPFVCSKVSATEELSGDQPQEGDSETKRVEEKRGGGKTPVTAEQLWNIRYILAPYIIINKIC